MYVCVIYYMYISIQVCVAVIDKIPRGCELDIRVCLGMVLGAPRCLVGELDCDLEAPRSSQELLVAS